ncbi:hypothetical protein ABE142_15705 [Paenibacillus alvei]|uniref:ComF family protein n=1 Tax=Paenibacillus alvei TaxID=44250 RepID=UPI003D298E64
MVSRMQLGAWIEKMYGTLLRPKLYTCMICKSSIQINQTAPSRPPIPNEQHLLPLMCRKCIHLIPWIDALGCSDCGRAIRCPDCQRHPLQNDGLRANRSVVQYDDRMKQWLAQYKFKGNREYEQIMLSMMQLAYEPLLSTVWGLRTQERRMAKLFKGRLEEILPDFITFVPTTRERLYARGFNQAEQLARALGGKWGRPVIELLARVQDAEKQSKQTRAGRENNMEHAFTLRHTALKLLQKSWALHCTREISGMEEVRLLLIDDVYTTGSTLRACSRQLSSICWGLGCPVSIVSYTWARA